MTSPAAASDSLLWLHLRGESLPDPPKAKEPEKPVGVRFKPGFGPPPSPASDRETVGGYEPSNLDRLMELQRQNQRALEIGGEGGSLTRRETRRLREEITSVDRLPYALAEMLQDCGAHVELSLTDDLLSETWSFTARIYVGRDQEMWYETKLSRRDTLYLPVLRDVLRDMEARIREAIRENTRIDVRP